VRRLEAARFTPQVRLDWQFGRDLVLVGYDRRDLGARDLEITYYWRALRTMTRRYAAYVHTKGVTPRLQYDSVLGEAEHTTEFWLPEEIVKQKVEIRIPDDAPPGSYPFRLGVWAPHERRRLKLWRSFWDRPRTGRLFQIEVSANGGGAAG
jgi:hypothetical protein